MKHSLFITGATGFIGTNLLKTMDLDDYEHVFCFGRKANPLISEILKRENFKFIKADISETGKYEPYLNRSDIVLHLAASTGKADRSEYFSTNSRGTDILLNQCRKHTIKRIIYMSTIAVEFENLEGYHYAHSKIKAEESVKASGIPYTILRPSIVIGEDAPVLKGLLQLARAPIVPIFGDGSVKIQPVYIDDLIRCTLNIIEHGSFENETLTIAGPEEITIEEFIRLLHNLSYDKVFKPFHLPVYPLRKTLIFLEKFLLPLMPFTAGQLASFTNNGVAEISPCLKGNGSGISGIDEMLRQAVSQETEEARNIRILQRECEAFTQYLINRSPDKYIQKKYLKAYRTLKYDMDANCFDLMLVRMANKNSFFLKLADTYTGVFYKKSLLRKKLLLLLAIMECSRSTYKEVNRVEECSQFALVMNMCQRVSVSFFMLFLSVLMFSPFKLYSSFQKGPGKQARLWKKY